MYKKTILSNVSWLTLQNLTFQAIGMVFYIYLARVLGKAGLGLYSYIFAVMGFVAMFLDFGFMAHFWRKWSTDLSQVKTDLETLVGSKLAMMVPVTLGLYLYLSLTDIEAIIPFSLAYIFTILDIFKLVPLYYFQAQNIFSKVFLINFVDKIIIFSSGLGLLYLGKGLAEIFVFFIIGRFIAVVLGFWLMKISFHPKLDLGQLRLIFKSSLLLFLVQALNNVYFKIDTVIIRQMIGFSSVGIYNAAYRVIESLSFVPNLLVFAVFTPLAQLSSLKKKEYSLGIVDAAIKYLMVVAVFVAVFFQFYATEIMDFLYGNSYLVSAQLLQVLGWVVVFMFINTLLSIYLVTSKQEHKLMTRIIGLIAFNIVGNILLLPHFGVVAAAVTTLVTEAIGAVVFLKLIGISLFQKWLGKILLVTGTMVLLLMNFHFALFPTLIILGALYVLALLSLKVINIKEVWPG
jgi:O-antigen/teichoic acid export membrane protein